ncbi:MAG: AAA family ATPase [Planctomycetota bacterium]|nr:AAA family ATPase [Planctomycetota bacterium]
MSDDSRPSDLAQAREAMERFRSDFALVREQVGRVVVGQQSVVEAALMALFVGGHVLLEGVPGIGKTLLVRTIARALRLTFTRIQFTPDLMPADVTGTSVVVESEDDQGRRQRTFRFQPGPIFGQIVLADEINRATPKTQSALLEAMQERAVTAAGTTHRLPEPFLVMATQNPVEQEGTYPLPEAQLDRFLFKILVGAPSRRELGEVLDRTTRGVNAEVSPVLDAERILAAQALVREVPITPAVQDYAVRVVLATHPRDERGWTSSANVASSSPSSGAPGGASGARASAATGGSAGGVGAAGLPRAGARESFSTPMVDQYVRLGASPRAAQAIILGAKCRALLDARASVAIDDVRSVALAALRHRLILNFEAGAEGVTPDAIVRNIVDTLPLES